MTERPQSANASRRSVFGSLKRPLVQAIDWLQQRRAQPFFLLLQGHDLRCPYQPSPPFDRQFDPDYQGTGDFSSCFWADGGSHPVLHGSTYAWPVWIASGQGEARRVFLSRRDLDHWIALYDGALLEADLGLANFFAAVAGLGLMERTLFVLMSEHGAMLGEHGSFSDQGPLCTSLFQPVLNVPLLVRHPRRTAIKSVSALVQTVDLLPTLVEMLGVADRSASLRQGRSLVPALRHPGTEVNPHAFAGTRSLSCRNSRYSGAAVAEAVRTPTWKMTREALYDPTTGERLGSSHRLYHLVFDPEERNDVLTEHRAVADQLERQLRAFFGPDPLVRQVPICED